MCDFMLKEFDCNKYFCLQDAQMIETIKYDNVTLL